VETRQQRPWEFLTWVPFSSYVVFLLAVAFTFMPVAFLVDITDLGTNPPPRVAANLLIAAGISVAYAFVAMRRPKWMPAVVAGHIIVATQIGRILPVRTGALGQDALRNRLTFDAVASIALIVVGYVLFLRFFRKEGARHVRAHTEIALARDIHRLLVPPIARRVGGFEFRGVSIPSGEVGGDLVDLVDDGDRWIGYVADVSGHGVASGLLMAMVKSAARMKLRERLSIDGLMDDLNVVLIDLKKPEMYVTFACVQFDGCELQFSLAGHLPILHYRAAQASIAELSVPQVPLAMFEERRFTAARVSCAPGDLLVIVTDGLTEVFDAKDREFGFEGVKALVVQHAHAPLESLTNAVLSAVRGHGPQEDDQTMLVVRAIA